MATQTRNQVIQVVRRGGNNLFDEQAMKTLITASDAAEDPYTVISIIGPQSSGKSTLMNGIFNTEFKVMDANIEWSRTTMGIWASINNNSRALVLDVEGTDSDDNQNDLGFDVRSALFALLISDVIILNIVIGEVNRANSNPLLTKIFQEVVKKVGAHGLPEQNETKFVVAVRNYNGLTPEVKMVEIITSKIKKIWDSIPQKENSKLQNYFKLHVELIPDYLNKEAKFNKKCEEIRGRIARGDLANKRLSRLLVFPSHASGIWKTIVENKKLDLPSHRETMARTTCAYIVSEILEHFKYSEYPKLTCAGHDNPRKFADQFELILNAVLSEYESETQVYGEYAKEEEETLKTKVSHLVSGELKSVMTRFEKKILEDTIKGIDIAYKKCHYWELEEYIASVVTKFHNEYLLQTEGLALDELNKEKFREKLYLIGEQRTAEFKKGQMQEMKLGAAKGVCIAVGGAALGATAPLTGAAAVGAACVSAVGYAAAVGLAIAQRYQRRGDPTVAPVEEEDTDEATVAPVEEEDMHGNTKDEDM